MLKDTRTIAAILAADVVAYSRLMGADEEGALAALRVRRAVFDELVKAFDGQEFGSVGDSLMAKFPSAVNAVLCAQAIQQRTDEQNAALPPARRMQLRIGINLGDVIEESGTAFGDAVNVAARVQSLAKPGGVLISGAVYDQVHLKIPARFINAGVRQVKNVTEPVRTFEVLPDEPSGLAGRISGMLGRVASRRGFPWRAAALFVAIAAASAIVLTVADPGEWRARLFGGPAKPVRTIAVLPLQNLSGDAAQDYFADGMTEALTTDLARIESLQVISHTSAMQYKAAKQSLPAIARALQADAVVEGSVQRSGSRVRVTAQLVRAFDDTHLWADSYERDLGDVLALQDDVASDIARQIESRLGGPKPAPAPKVQAINPEAYEAYLRANSYFDSFDLQKSIDYYRQAIKLDPNYAPAYAHMAQAYSYLAFFGAVSPREGWGKAKEAAIIALQKDAGLPEGHGALALAKLHYDWDFAGAEQEFKRALELNPSDADIRHDYAHYLMAVGRVTESRAETERALELDPVGAGLTSCLCWHSFAARDYDEAVRLAEKFLKSQPDDAWERTILGWTYEQKQMPDRAVAEFKRAVAATNGDAFFVAALGHAYALAGQRREAEKVLQTLTDRARKSYVSPFDLALIQVALGEKDKAFALLDKAVAEHSTFLVYVKWEPRLDPLRSDPRFEELLRRIALPG